MKCKKCGSSNITYSVNTYTKTKSRSFLWNLFMLCFTGGFWLLWMLVRKKKEKIINKKVAICQNCGTIQ